MSSADLKSASEWLPLTGAQQQLWTGQRLDPDSAMYSMALAFRIDGDLEVDVFRRAFDELLARTDALRTVFAETPDGARRRALPDLDFEIEFEDLSHHADAESTLPARLLARTQKPFAIDGLLFDTRLIKLAPSRFVWFLNQHHLITDAWSTSLLFEHLSQLYTAARDSGFGDVLNWPSYEIFAQHELKVSSGRHGQRAAAHWQEAAKETQRPTLFYGELARDKADAGGRGRTDRSRRVVLDLGPARSVGLRALAEGADFRALTSDQAHFQIFSTVLLAFLHRVSGAEIPGFSAPSHNRSTKALRETAGLLIELFPLSVAIDANESFLSLNRKTARASQTRILNAAAGSSPLAPQRDVILNFIRAGFGDFAGHATQSEWIHPGCVDRNHKMRVQVSDFDQTGEFRVELDLNEDVFGAREAEWAKRHLLTLIDALLEDPGQKISATRLTAAAELESFAPSGSLAPRSRNVVERFREQVAQNPDRVAIADGDRQISYSELHVRAGSISAALIARGIRPGDRVGVLMDRSPELVASLLGVLEAGATYVPLDPSYPAARIEFIATDSDFQLTVTTRDLAGRAANWAGGVLCADDLDNAPEATPRHEVAPDDRLAYVLYTSGTTGRPKGVMISHGALANYIDWAARTYSAGSGEGQVIGANGVAVETPLPTDFALFTSPAFDLTVTSIFTPLVTGGQVIVYGRDQSDDAFVVRRVVEDDRADVVKLTPSHLALIRDHDFSQSRIRTLILGGEDLPTSLAAALHDGCGGRLTLFNEYGPTEATVGCMIHRYDREQDTSASVPVGVPADNVRIYVVDEGMQLVPCGQSGEILIGGAGLANGYLGLDDKTRDAFVADPVLPKERVYRSGDRGRWNRLGQLEFQGRLDSQVKWRGARIELAEVEAVLATHPQIRQCAAKLVEPKVRSEIPERCALCGLEENHPDAQLDAEKVCAVCRGFEKDRVHVQSYFGTMEELEAIFAEARDGARGSSAGENDSLMLVSGGKDSTYALSRVVDLGMHPLVFHLDNGYISEQALGNVRRVVEDLGLELVVGKTDAMDRIFVDSLRRYSNVCNGCFKTIYTMSMNIARERGLRTIITGLSRGQIFETRLADLYRRRLFDPAEIDRTVIEARKGYHRMEDEVSRSLDVEIFRDDRVFDEIIFVDFYRYCSATLDEMLSYLGERTSWVRPSDTGRSTNCRLNEVGIYVHKNERGFHNYALPYSWDVRLGHKERDAAVQELDDDIDEPAARETLFSLGYRQRAAANSSDRRLAAYYCGTEELSASELRRFLSARLPADSIPSVFVSMESLPLSPNGKVDRSQLPQPSGQRPVLDHVYIAPRTGPEKSLAGVWGEVLGIDQVGIDDDYFELGGDSIQCLHIISAIAESGWEITPQQLFEQPTIVELAPLMIPLDKSRVTAKVAPASASPEELAELLGESDAEMGGSS